ncbi:DUF2808 domain-containing protein [Pseudanabaena yagii]|uniref:DUF2808 domain-containing protein n=1 Tax=Pseudanabaena yagii GIHE-NHR1 TaxID=2722753 RepID=A0ABX1LYS5_9CYAN|nr:DUF2808 domain-containing protein [Pseudanabaena yagii]NMF60670.1 DUF2808 domain-containing protein [Pseudanabaena yagii GIHE-NHR1]
MKYLNRLAIPCLLMGLSLSAISVIIPKINSAIAQDLTVSSSPKGFIQFPSLISADTSDLDTNTRNAIYSFQIFIPQQAGASLKKVTIVQKDPIEPISFVSDRTTAYIQEPSGDLTPVGTQTAIDPNTRSVSVVFTSPIPAGKTVIVGLRPQSNPSLEGEYVFGVTAFSDKQQSQGQSIGEGRLGIYNTPSFTSFAPNF